MSDKVFWCTIHGEVKEGDCVEISGEVYGGLFCKLCGRGGRKRKIAVASTHGRFRRVKHAKGSVSYSVVSAGAGKEEGNG